MQRELHITRTYGPEDQGRYLRLPFDVPAEHRPGGGRVRVRPVRHRGAAGGPAPARGGHRRPRPLRRVGAPPGLVGLGARLRGHLRLVGHARLHGGPGGRGPLGGGPGAVQDRRGRRGAVTIRLPEKRETLLAGDLHVHTVNSDGSAPHGRDRRAGPARRASTSWRSRTTTAPGRTTRSAGVERHHRDPRDGVHELPRPREPLLPRRGIGRFDVGPALQQPRGDAGHDGGRAGDGRDRSRSTTPTTHLCPWTFGFEGFAWDLVEAWNGHGRSGRTHGPSRGGTTCSAAARARPWSAAPISTGTSRCGHSALPRRSCTPPPGPPTTSWRPCVAGQVLHRLLAGRAAAGPPRRREGVRRER